MSIIARVIYCIENTNMKEFSQMKTRSLNEPKCRNSFYSWEKFSLYVTESTKRTAPMQDQEMSLEDSKKLKG